MDSGWSRRLPGSRQLISPLRLFWISRLKVLHGAAAAGLASSPTPETQVWV